jgi:hypothetical protein
MSHFSVYKWTSTLWLALCILFVTSCQPLTLFPFHRGQNELWENDWRDKVAGLWWHPDSTSTCTGLICYDTSLLPQLLSAATESLWPTEPGYLPPGSHRKNLLANWAFGQYRLGRQAMLLNLALCSSPSHPQLSLLLLALTPSCHVWQAVSPWHKDTLLHLWTLHPYLPTFFLMDYQKKKKKKKKKLRVGNFGQIAW